MGVKNELDGSRHCQAKTLVDFLFLSLPLAFFLSFSLFLSLSLSSTIGSTALIFKNVVVVVWWRSFVDIHCWKTGD